MYIETADFDYIREIVHQESGVIIREDMAYFVESRLASVARLNAFNSINDLIISAKNGGYQNEIKRLIIESMMIFESSFFRDKHYFETVREELIPSIISHSDNNNYELNIWSAACSRGQEIYSTAFMIDYFNVLPSTWKVNYMASDFSGELLKKAKEGVFNQFEINRGLSGKLIEKYFIAHDGSDLQVNPSIRSRIKFVKFNLFENGASIPQMDIIFLRNVMIYFNDKDKNKVLENVSKRLKPNGFLILGSTESLVNNILFEPVHFQKAIIYKLKSK
ncbi:MAG: protein-glutamate O-methyltransferase CheR [Prolixibacteraceae bacterium]|jgi:chemotaxis protein methyltransferase CheR|nr:protein-glutamate O-methyltransferase CheR [Prolixibacteraceae bacterium]MBT6767317.1 protein-glutamate O-methyltransferase CheR [Prolixibacteraceae bacterium]MBT6998111.1 protein-glutamate O-methyltransferase CheR [Prolixibacteraceae bacterium]MBT7394956.1 protein-glutamate O-methyltransferase CheR [Prolixibacteraceae bacterium]